MKSDNDSVLFLFLRIDKLMKFRTYTLRHYYPKTHPITTRWVYALTFLRSVLWIKAEIVFMLAALPLGLMGVGSLSPLYRRLGGFCLRRPARFGFV